jgi:hypothetical protein
MSASEELDMRINVETLGALVTSVAVAGLLSTAWAQDEGSTGADEAPEYLISVAAVEGAALKQGGREGCFTLTLTDAKHVTWFSDRPVREAHSSDAANLISLWEDAFADDPPNADLQMFGDDGGSVTVILELNDAPVWHPADQALVFANACAIHIDEDGGEAVSTAAGSFPIATLFIDGAKLFAWNSCVYYNNDYKCMEQWGSYPLSCMSGPRIIKAKYSGKKCNNVCKNGNCYTKYDGYDSGLNFASTYWCSKEPGTANCAP